MLLYCLTLCLLYNLSSKNQLIFRRLTVKNRKMDYLVRVCNQRHTFVRIAVQRKDAQTNLKEIENNIEENFTRRETRREIRFEDEQILYYDGLITLLYAK